MDVRYIAGYDRLMEEPRTIAHAPGDKGAGNPVFDLPPNILDELARMNIHATDDAHKFHHAPTRITIRRHLERQ